MKKQQLAKIKRHNVQFWLSKEQHRRLKKYADWLGTRPNEAARQAMVAIVLGWESNTSYRATRDSREAGK